MSRLLRKGSQADFDRDGFMDNPPFPLAGAAVGLIVVTNIASTMLMLITS